MKNLILTSLFLFAFIIGFQSTAEAVVAPKNNTPLPESVFDLPNEDLINLDREALEKKVGRSLKWKEKVALKWIKRKAKNQKGKKWKTENNDDEGEGVDGMAIAGFVLGLLGFLRWGLLFGILGIIFSAIALRRIRRNPEKGGKGLAIAGLVTGIVVVAVWLLLIALALVLI